MQIIHKSFEDVTLTTIELYPHRNAVKVCHWHNPDVAGLDDWAQYVCYNSVSIRVPLKLLYLPCDKSVRG